MNKLYYGPKNTTSNEYRLSPVPKITINKNITYAGDTIIGYTYNININGYISTLRDLRSSSSEQKNDTNSGIGTVFQNMDIVRSILMRNGGFLRLIDESNNTLIEAGGGTLKSLSFDESENQWTKYSPFKAEIEFNELSILGESNVNSIDVDSITSNIININTSKIKTYNESWNFDIAEDDYYNFVFKNDLGQPLLINNNKINISYSLSATGKNYYNDDGTVKAAWLQAKDFVQDRLYKQVTALVGGILTITGDICSANKTLGSNSGTISTNQDPSQINYIGGQSGLLNTINSYYKVYNEGVTCETSESEGTFSVNYNSIIKHNKTGMFDSSNVIHTVTKDISYELNHSSAKVINVSVKGSIKGLIEGGLLTGEGNFELPQNGRFVITKNDDNQFGNAELFLSNIIDVDNDDLTGDFKDALGITSAFDSSTIANCVSADLIPSSFSLTKDYVNANIEYSVEYSSEKIGEGNKDYYAIFKEFSVDESNPIIAEKFIPGSSFYGREGKTIHQDISTQTIRKITLTIEGRNYNYKSCCGNDLLALANDGFILPNNIENSLPDPDIYILASRQASFNPMQGSYTVNLNYICKQGYYI